MHLAADEAVPSRALSYPRSSEGGLRTRGRHKKRRHRVSGCRSALSAWAGRGAQWLTYAKREANVTYLFPFPARRQLLRYGRRPALHTAALPCIERTTRRRRRRRRLVFVLPSSFLHDGTYSGAGESSGAVARPALHTALPCIETNDASAPPRFRFLSLFLSRAGFVGVVATQAIAKGSARRPIEWKPHRTARMFLLPSGKGNISRN